MNLKQKQFGSMQFTVNDFHGLLADTSCSSDCDVCSLLNIDELLN